MSISLPSRFLFMLSLSFLFLSCSHQKSDRGGWRKVFQNDEQGEVVMGDKQELMDAVRLGYPIRMGWGGRRVEHVAGADFLTIFEGEVFGQVDAITGQAPAIDGDTVKIRFRPENHWTKIAGTNGFSTGLMTNYLHDTIAGGNEDGRSATSWYVLYPPSQGAAEAKPLWRKDSPKWNQK